MMNRTDLIILATLLNQQADKFVVTPIAEETPVKRKVNR